MHNSCVLFNPIIVECKIFSTVRVTILNYIYLTNQRHLHDMNDNQKVEGNNNNNENMTGMIH